MVVMEINQVIMKEIKQNNNMITTAQVVSLGFSRALLSKCVKEGLLERGRQGVYILPELFTVGMVRKKTTFGNEVRCYDVEHTICDLLRSRSRMDEETVISAIKNYAAFKDKDLNRLAAYAEQ